jgi:hypothetical protein
MFTWSLPPYPSNLRLESRSSAILLVNHEERGFADTRSHGRPSSNLLFCVGCLELSVLRGIHNAAAKAHPTMGKKSTATLCLPWGCPLYNSAVKAKPGGRSRNRQFNLIKVPYVPFYPSCCTDYSAHGTPYYSISPNLRCGSTSTHGV